MRMSKGEKTKKRIEDASRELFHEKGYKNTLVKDIIGKVNIAPGNLTYYFPTKDTIAVELVVQYMENIEVFLNEKLHGCKLEMKMACSMIIFYENILKDKKTAAFFEEIIRRKNVHYLIHDRNLDNYEKVLNEAGVSANELDMKLFKATDVGARYEMMCSYFDNKFEGVETRKFIRMMYIIALMALMGYSVDANAIFDEAQKLVEHLDINALKLLV